jgi:hypothetical protein
MYGRVAEPDSEVVPLQLAQDGSRRQLVDQRDRLPRRRSGSVNFTCAATAQGDLAAADREIR